MKANYGFLPLCAAFLAAPCVAQTAPVAAQPMTTAQAVAVLDAPAPASVLRAGTEVPLLLREELTTKEKKLRVGQRVQMEVGSNVSVNGVVVIPAGTPAIGEITEVRNKGMWGKSGYIGARVLSLRLGDRHVRLTGTFDDKGVTGTGGVIAAVALIPVAGFFTTGTSAMIPLGAAVKGFLDEDVSFRTASAPVQPVDAPAVGSQPTPSR
ncbi:hypothetical protein [Rhizorhabdus sp. FW153]|uniref:hypothetical protein n=1 Tax=Rhizorhabdus sp. FW153 TaxID=3400216 RepID=UPI003CF50274